jgi:hypothetical protein
VVGLPRFASQPADVVGGFLEGAFAPLAFLWLVIGFFMQQKELSANARAIRLQYREMKRSAEQAEVQARAISLSELHQRQDTFLKIPQPPHLLRAELAAGARLAGEVEEARRPGRERRPRDLLARTFERLLRSAEDVDPHGLITDALRTTGHGVLYRIMIEQRDHPPAPAAAP